jgi:hypothetical protein
MAFTYFPPRCDGLLYFALSGLRDLPPAPKGRHMVAHCNAVGNKSDKVCLLTPKVKDQRKVNVINRS